MDSIGSMTVSELLRALAGKRPTPGGGAVASVVGALAAALGGMVVAYSVGKRSLAGHQTELEAAVHKLANARAMLLRLADEDAAAYERLSKIMKLDEADERRRRELQPAVQMAIAAPMSVLATASDLSRLLEELAPITNRHLCSDLAIAAILAEAAARSAGWNVRINLPMLEGEPDGVQGEDEVKRMLVEIRERVARIEQSCAV